MTRLRRLALLVMGVPIVAGMVPRPLYACDCVRLPALSPAVRREAAYIFEGTVVEIVERSEHTTTTYDGGAKSSVRPLDRRVVFQVASAWRGVDRERISVIAELSDCMFAFEIGQRYLVFANRDARGRAWTSICTRTTAFGDAVAIVQALGAPSYRAGHDARSQ